MANPTDGVIVGTIITLSGLGVAFNPRWFAERQATFWKKRYGIVAGAIGSGTVWGYRSLGTAWSAAGVAICLKAIQ